MLHSSDAGEHWHFKQFSTPAPVITSLALADGVALAGTLEDGSFFSPDGGATWFPRSYGLLDSGVLALTFTPAGIAFAGTSSGLFRSGTGGRSWQETSFPATAAPILSLASLPSGELLVGTETDGLWQSIDNGKRWNSIYHDQWNGPINHLYASDDGAIVFAACGCCLLMSGDSCLSWTRVRVFTQPITSMTTPPVYHPRNPIWIGMGDGVLIHLP